MGLWVWVSAWVMNQVSEEPEIFKLKKMDLKSINLTSFPGKSTTLNPMVKSDLVTSGDGTVPNFIL